MIWSSSQFLGGSNFWRHWGVRVKSVPILQYDLGDCNSHPDDFGKLAPWQEMMKIQQLEQLGAMKDSGFPDILRVTAIVGKPWIMSPFFLGIQVGKVGQTLVSPFPGGPLEKSECLPRGNIIFAAKSLVPLSTQHWRWNSKSRSKWHVSPCPFGLGNQHQAPVGEEPKQRDAFPGPHWASCVGDPVGPSDCWMRT